MWSHQSSGRSSVLAILIGLALLGVGIVVGFTAGAKPVYVGLAFVAIAVLVCLFAFFEQTVLGLLILRSSLDPLSAQQIPAAFGIGLDALTLLYVTYLLLTRQRVRTDRFFWFFASWVALQALWVVLPALGWGLGTPYLMDNLREWVRIFSWLMVYLLVMQLKERTHPQKAVTALFFSLIVPLTVGFAQVFLPTHLPSVLTCPGCLNSTIGHPSAFGSFLYLFISLTLWKLGHARQRLPWIILLAPLAFLMVMTKSFTSIIMFFVFILVIIAPKLNLVKLIGGVLFLAIVITLFASTPFGLEKLSGLLNTPLFNSDIDVSRTILLSNGDGNSANWRIAQWFFLLQSWQKSPLLGYGLATAPYLTFFTGYYAHNDYVRFLVETGIVGLTAFLTFLGVQFFRLLQLLRSSPVRSSHRNLCLTMIAIFAGLVVGMASDNIWSHTTLFFYWSFLSTVVGWDWKESQNQRIYSSPKSENSGFLEKPGF